ncbi:MAG: hypothetical protein ABR570_14455 [Burkholderiales bacterium]
MKGQVRRGLLLTMTEPPAAMEEEFNAWYDTEHLAERLAIRGFRSARRWVADCRPGEGKYLATYELDSSGVLQSAQYLARFQDATPWTRRCLEKTVVFRRWACEQVDPGNAEPQPLAKALLLIAHDAPFELPSVASALQARRFVAHAGAPAHIALVEFAWPKPARLPAAPEGALARLYRAYGT